MSAPGIKEEIPWRAENIRRITIQAIVADRTDKSISIDYALGYLYDCRNDKEKPGFYYFDSRYQQDFAFDNNTSNRQIMRVTYDRKSRKPLASDKKDSFYSYSKTYVPFGVRQEGLPAYSGNICTGFVKPGGANHPGSQWFPHRLERRRDYPNNTGYTSYRCLIRSSTEYGIYL